MHCRRVWARRKPTTAHNTVVITEAHSDEGPATLLAHDVTDYQIVATHGGDGSGGVLVMVRLTVLAGAEVDLEVFQDGKCVGVRWAGRGKTKAVVGGLRLLSHAPLGERHALLRRVRDFLQHPTNGRGICRRRRLSPPLAGKRVEAGWRTRRHVRGLGRRADRAAPRRMHERRLREQQAGGPEPHPSVVRPSDSQSTACDNVGACGALRMQCRRQDAAEWGSGWGPRIATTDVVDEDRWAGPSHVLLPKEVTSRVDKLLWRFLRGYPSWTPTSVVAHKRMGDDHTDPHARAVPTHLEGYTMRRCLRATPWAPPFPKMFAKCLRELKSGNS